MRWASSNEMFERAATSARRVSGTLDALLQDLQNHKSRDEEGELRLAAAREAAIAVTQALNAASNTSSKDRT